MYSIAFGKFTKYISLVKVYCSAFCVGGSDVPPKFSKNWSEPEESPIELVRLLRFNSYHERILLVMLDTYHVKRPLTG